MIEIEKQNIKNKTIKILQEIVKSGYVPSRCEESYSYITKLGFPAYNIVNCFYHACFNLTNEQLDKYNFDENMRKSISGFDYIPFDSNEKMSKQMLALIKETGLNVEPATQDTSLKKNEWMIALYFSKNGLFKDYHVLLKEKENVWSSKEGLSKKIFSLDKLPKKYTGVFFNYKFYNIYKIENPYAREN